MSKRGTYASGREAVQKALSGDPRFVIDPIPRKAGDCVGGEELVHHWTINVARRAGTSYVHCFRTQPMHLTREEAAGAYAAMVKAFPAPEWDVQLDAHIEYAVTVKPRRIA